MHQNDKQARIQNVEKDYQRLFQSLEIPRVPQGLKDSIFLRINREERRTSIIKLAVFVPLALLSGVAVVASFQYLMNQTAQSGFSEYIAILFSDGGTLLSYWKEFLLSVAERAPIIGTALFLGAILTLMGSIKSVLRNAHTVLHSSQLAS